MKDLFKGHHPWLLVLVFTAALLIAGILRHTFLSFGHTDFNANLTFIIVLLAIVSIYALFFEYRRDGSFPKLIVAKPIAVAESTSSPTMSDTVVSETTILPNSEEINEKKTWSLDDFKRIKEEITSDILMAINSQNTEIKDDSAGMSTFQINISKVHRETALAREEEQKQLFDKACKYTLEVLGPYVTPEGIEVIFGRIMRFMQAVGATWEVRSAKELKENIEAVKITPIEPLAKIDLLHYGWNIGLMFGKSGLQIGYFLKTTFGHHFDRLTERSISKKLTMGGKCIINRISEFHRDFRNKKQQNLHNMVRDYEAEHNEAERRAKRKQVLEEKEKREEERERIRLEKEKEDARMAAILKKNPNLQLRQPGDPEDEEIIENPYYSKDYYEDDDWDDEEYDVSEDSGSDDLDEEDFDRKVMDAMANGKMPECFDGFDMEGFVCLTFLQIVSPDNYPFGECMERRRCRFGGVCSPLNLLLTLHRILNTGVPRWHDVFLRIPDAYYNINANFR